MGDTGALTWGLVVATTGFVCISRPMAAASVVLALIWPSP